MMTEG